MKFSDKKMKWIGALIVALAVLAVFLPVLNSEFLNWDDEKLFLQNPYFRGLGLSHWRWMCSTLLLGHWQPLSWLSCAVDYTVWGMNPQGWHATNLLLHTANAELVYLLCLAFFEKQNSRYGAATLAALFWAVHPLRVETAAWLATRGYLLCTAFCLLTVLLYLRSVKERRYPLAALLCFVLATFTKGIGMMLPPALLLMDLFPLRRIMSVRTAAACVVEKIPFFALSLLTGVIAFLAKKFEGGMAPVEKYGLVERFGQAVYGVWFYLLKTVSPFSLSPFCYKQPEAGTVVVALVLTTMVVIFLFLYRHKLRPVAFVLGAFLLLIFPMLGFTQSGFQTTADRFTYLATVPFSLLLVAVLNRIRVFKKMIYSAVISLLIVFGAQAASFCVTWSNSIMLWSWAVSLDDNNASTHNSLGQALLNRNHFEEALARFEHAIQLEPADAMARRNRALTLAQLGRFEEAFAEWAAAFSLPGNSKQDLGKISLTRGWVFEQTGNLTAAGEDYTYVADDVAMDLAYRCGALQLRSALYARMGQKEKALADLKTVLELPDPFGDRWQQAQDSINELRKTDEK